MTPPITSRAPQDSAAHGAVGVAVTRSIEGAATSVGRLDYIDWLRLLAVALLLPFHSARVFDVFDTFYVKNAVLSGGLSAILVDALQRWEVMGR